MASEGMILTNHDHQIRVGILTARARFGQCHRLEYYYI
uniref:Uncharacterized protein n=1 Tax=Hucho hucho TaxID=62062 RepID=A0A4W5RR77_9TELE